MKIAGILSYVGAPFAGFQRQENGRTVQGELEKALTFLIGAPTTIKAAGRTDAKVSAEGQVFSFLIDRPVKLDYFKMQLNRQLPEEMAVHVLKFVPDSFDPRHSAIAKEYIYRFYLGQKDPFKKDLYARFREEIFDFETFSRVLQGFVGVHDFSNYTSKKEDKDNFIRRVDKAETHFDKERKEGYVLFLANGFMTYQIRYMVGMALAVCAGKRTYEEAMELLVKKPRCIISTKAPAEGLCLKRVIYDEKLGL